jgi:hypothetical protein
MLIVISYNYLKYKNNQKIIQNNIRYEEILDSLDKAVKWQTDATFVIRNEYNCTQNCKSWGTHNCWYGFITSEHLIDQGYLKQKEMLDVDNKSYCKSTIYTYLSEYDGETCDVEYEIHLKCQDYETPGYLEHPDSLWTNTP